MGTSQLLLRKLGEPVGITNSKSIRSSMVWFVGVLPKPLLIKTFYLI